MKIQDKDLVRVKSHDELRAGMTLVNIENGRSCVLLRVIPNYHGEHESDGSPCATPRAFVDTDDWHPGCYCRTINAGTRFRLRDLEEGEEDQEATTAQKERVKCSPPQAPMT